MKAKMFIKGLREPIELEKNEATVAQALKSDINQSNETPFTIKDVWSGTKGDIKYIIFPDKEKIFEAVRPMSDEEAKEFEKIVKECRAVAEKKSLKSYFWDDIYLENKGAVSLDIQNRSNGTIGVERIISNPNLYTKYEEIVERYKLWLGKKEFVEKNKIEALEETFNVTEIYE